MAKSLPFDRHIDRGSDHVPEQHCEPCFEVFDAVKIVAGYCQNWDQELCFDCFSTHLPRKQFRSHKLVDNSSRPKTLPTPQTKPQNLGEPCLLHHEEQLQSFCPGHAEFCCKVCITINHQTCKTEEISKLVRNIKNSQELQDLNNTLKKLKKIFKDNLNKTKANESIIQKNHEDAIIEMKKLQDEFDKLMTETRTQADKAKEEDYQKSKQVSATCGIVIEQINKLTNNLYTMKKNGDNEHLLFAMKRAESQITSLEESLDNLDQDSAIREYKFEPDEKLATIFKDIQVLGQLLFKISQPTDFSRKVLSDQKAKRATFVKDIQVKSSSYKTFDLYGSVVLPSNQILITDWQNSKIKLIDTNFDKIISEIQVSGNPNDITEMEFGEFAVTVRNPNKLQFISVSQNSLSRGVEISVNGKCTGIAYNDTDQTLIVITYSLPDKIEILNMKGDVINRIDKESEEHQSFTWPLYVYTLSSDMTGRGPIGMCAHSSGLLYNVGSSSHTLHQLDIFSCERKVLLEQKDGLSFPMSISYCYLEDKIYIGMGESSVL